MPTFSAVRTVDVRFPTSTTADGSDAMNLDPDYSAAYLVLATDASDGLEGHGFVFTIGRGNDVQVMAVAGLAERLVGRDVDSTLADLGSLWRELIDDSQLRWLGPDKGVAHMAVGAVVNALWDLRAKRAGLPLWQLLAGLGVDEVLDLIDFRYLEDLLTREQARGVLERAVAGRAARVAELLAHGYPAYTTTPGWLGYDDEKLVRLSREAVEQGFGQIKLKVGLDLDEDRRRLRLAREAVGPDVAIAVDANQRWGVAEAVEWTRALAEVTELAWVEEPTHPDDVLGHAAIARAVAPVPVASGEHLANRVLAKQFLQASAVGVLQIDATRVAGVNENIALLLMAAHTGVRVCPHAGGVGLCELVQHLSMFDLLAVSGTGEGRVIEYVDHLHEHFVTPVVIRDGRYVAPVAPGAGAQMHEASVAAYTYDAGA